MWRGIHKILTEIGYEVKLANPKKTHDIAGSKKMDKIDAKTLADLLRTKYLPEVWIPDEQTLQFRDLARHKSNLTRLKTQVQGKIRGYLLRKGAKYSKLSTEKTLSTLAEEDLDIKNLVHVPLLKRGGKRGDAENQKNSSKHERNNHAYEHARDCRILLSNDTRRNRRHKTFPLLKRTSKLRRPLLRYLSDRHN